MTNAPANSASQRRNYYIDREFQTNFILKFCALVVAGAMLTILLLYFFAQYATTVAIVEARVTVASAADYILPLLVQTVIIATIVVSIAAAAVTLFVSHKIAGPLYRFKQTLNELCAGNFTNQVRLRKGDQLHEFAGEFNEMITIVHDRVRTAESCISMIRRDIEAIGESGVEESKRRQFNELRQKVAELDKTIKFFRT